MILTFDKVILYPGYSTINSRLDVDLTTEIVKGLTLKHPIVSTNMSTVTCERMAFTMYKKTGGIGLLHRFKDPEEYVEEIENLKASNCKYIPSVGVNEEDKELLTSYIGFNHPAILIDIAHGHHVKMAAMIKFIKDNCKTPIIAGNVATYDGAKFLADLGVDAIRVGISFGSVCSTRTVTGHGVPTLESIYQANRVRNEGNYSFKIIGDGGFKTTGDIVKAIAFGADVVSLGYMLTGTSDSPGTVITHEGRKYKMMYGMSSKMAQEKRGKMSTVAAEGVDTLVPYIGNTEEVMTEYVNGVKSGLSYSGAFNIAEFRRCVKWDIV